MSALRVYEQGKPKWLPEEPGVGRLTTRWFKGHTIEIEHGQPELVRREELRRRREANAAAKR